MIFSTILSLGLLAPFATATVFDVTVGSSTGTLAFNPETIDAVVGDQVVFHFEQKNHTATQSSFASPCSQKEGGFSSGFNPVAANVTGNFPTYTVTVNDTEPIWVYCAQAAGTAASHCGQGMVFAVNCGPTGSNTSFTSFKDSALAIGAALQAGASSTVAGYPATSTGTATGSATTHTITVGANSELVYSPNEVTAQPGDTVVFQFSSKNHTVTQSSFNAPCEKLQFTSTTGQIGFDSGFTPVAANSTEFPSFSIVVNDTTPIWGYCRQDNPESHCGQGMVFAINAVDNGPKNFTTYQALAKQINGTSTTTASGSSGTSSSNVSGASRVGAGAGLGLMGVALALLL